jgi:hypothetical protein
MVFDLYNPRVTEAIRRAVFDFCQATLDTALTDARRAYQGLRAELIAGLEGGETNRELAARVRGVFMDPYRAARIARTESARAVHSGQLEYARETGIVSQKKWLASSDACDLCLKLAAMGAIDLDAPYFVHQKGHPAYRVVMHPPAHSFCMCSQLDVLNESAIGVASLPRPSSYSVPGVLRLPRREMAMPLAASYVPPWVK